MLVELLRATSREDEAREQLEKLAGEIEGRGERLGHRPNQEQTQSRQEEESGTRPSRPPVGLVFLDTGVDLPIAPPASAAAVPAVVPPDGLLLSEPIGTADDIAMADESVELVPGLERALEVDLEVTGLDSNLDLERAEPADLEFIGEPLEGMDQPEGDLVDADLLDSPADDLIVSVVDESMVIDDSMEVPDSGPEVVLVLVEPDLDVVGTEGRGPTPPGYLPLLPLEPVGEAGVVELESLILDDPDNPELHLRLADRLLADGEDIRGLEELELALAGYERLGEWPRAA